MVFILEMYKLSSMGEIRAGEKQDLAKTEPTCFVGYISSQKKVSFIEYPGILLQGQGEGI